MKASIIILRKIDKYIGNIILRTLSISQKNKAISKADKSSDRLSNKDFPANPKRILFIKLFGFGNIILLSPTIRHMKDKFPGCKIDVLTFSQNKPVCIMYPHLINETQTIRFSHKIIFDLVKAIISNRKKYDIIIDCEQFINISAIAGFLMKPKFFIGISTIKSGKSKIFDLDIIYREDRHIVDEYYLISKAIDKISGKVKPLEKMSDSGIHIESLRYTESDKVRKIFARVKKYAKVGMCLGGREENTDKRYTAGMASSLISALLQDKNVVIIFFASKNEYAETENIINDMPDELRHRCYNLSGKLSLEESTALISHMDLFISNDTGPLHIASSLKIMSIGLFGPTPEKIYGPYNRNSIVLRDMRHKPTLSSHNEKNMSWNPEWWPSPEKVYKTVMRYLYIHEKRHKKQ